MYKNETTKELDILRDFSEYQHPISSEIKQEELGSLLAYLIDRKAMEEHERVTTGDAMIKEISEILFKCLGKFLNVTSYRDTYRLLSAYAYNSSVVTFFGHKNQPEDYCAISEASLKSAL